MVEKVAQHLARAVQAVEREVQVIYEKDNAPPANRRVVCRGGGFAVITGYICLGTDAASNSIKETNLARLPVNQQLKLIAIQAIDEPSGFVHHRDVGLNQLSVGADNFIGSSLLLRVQRRWEHRNDEQRQ